MHIGNGVEDIRRRGSAGHWPIIFRSRHVSSLDTAKPLVAHCHASRVRRSTTGSSRQAKERLVDRAPAFEPCRRAQELVAGLVPCPPEVPQNDVVSRWSWVTPIAG
jgi:hypothetical protein